MIKVSYAYDVELINKIVCELGIDNNQLHLLCLLALKEKGKTSAELERYKSQYRMFHPDHERYIIAIMEDLVAKGFIEDLNHKDALYKYYNADYLLVTPKFTEKLYGDSDELGQQLWDAYPKKLLIDGREISAKSNTSVEEVCEKYPKIIKRDKRLHTSILAKIADNYTVYAEMGLDKFINSRHWEFLEDKAVRPDDGSQDI